MPFADVCPKVGSGHEIRLSSPNQSPRPAFSIRMRREDGSPSGRRPVTSVAAGLSTDPQRLYVANGDGSVSVIDLATGTEVLRIANAGARKMAAYYTN